MNVHAPVLREQHEHYKAVRAKLWGSHPAAARPAIDIRPIVQFVEPLPPAEPEWMSIEIEFDHHVLLYRKLISKLLLEYSYSMPVDKRSAKEIIIEVLEMFPGVNFRDVQGPTRTLRVVRARQVAMCELAEQRPDLSMPVIGSIFGDRDHTTVLHAIRKIKAMKAAGECLYMPSETF